MNDFLVLIIIWIVITLISKLTKKSKGQQKRIPPVVTPSSQQKQPEIPPFLRDLFGIPEEKVPQDSKEEMEDAELYLPLEPDHKLTEMDEWEDKKDKISLRDKEKTSSIGMGGVQPEVIDDIKIKNIISQSKISQSKTKKYLSLLRKGSLKEGIILKEILDKPISLRKYLRFNTPFKF